MSYKTEFPRFVLDVELPPGFADVSYHNDGCPRFVNIEERVILFVDFADPSDRETPSDKRFVVMETDDEGQVLPVLFLLTDDFADVLELFNEWNIPGAAGIEGE